MVLYLDAFSTELLLKIFKYLSISDLCRLKQTCKRFSEIIEKWAHSLNKQVIDPLVTNQVHSVVGDRSLRSLAPFERLRVSRNWKLGVYKGYDVLYTKVKYLPWLQLERDVLWISRGGCVHGYQRNRTRGINTRNVNYVIRGNNLSDVCHFVKKNNLIFSGQADGSIQLWSVDEKSFIFNLYQVHYRDVNAVDMNDIVMVSGSSDNHVKFWNKPSTDTPTTCLHTIDLEDRIWSVALSDYYNSVVAIGSSGIDNIKTITVYDLNHQAVVNKFGSTKFGCGVLDIKWENSSVWSCGYDGYVRRWDLRTEKCEQAFADPYGATVYCFQYDHCNTILTGTQNNGRIVLWDTRQRNYVQMYFMDCCRGIQNSSPVYSLSHDADFLFAVTDQYVNILDFSVFRGRPRDYANIFKRRILQ